jgi:hypothetical protein
MIFQKLAEINKKEKGKTTNYGYRSYLRLLWQIRRFKTALR